MLQHKTKYEYLTLTGPIKEYPMAIAYLKQEGYTIALEDMSMISNAIEAGAIPETFQVSARKCISGLVRDEWTPVLGEDGIAVYESFERNQTWQQILTA